MQTVFNCITVIWTLLGVGVGVRMVSINCFLCGRKVFFSLSFLLQGELLYSFINYIYLSKLNVCARICSVEFCPYPSSLPQSPHPRQDNNCPNVLRAWRRGSDVLARRVERNMPTWSFHVPFCTFPWPFCKEAITRSPYFWLYRVLTRFTQSLFRYFLVLMGFTSSIAFLECHSTCIATSCVKIEVGASVHEKW